MGGIQGRIALSVAMLLCAALLHACAGKSTVQQASLPEPAANPGPPVNNHLPSLEEISRLAPSPAHIVRQGSAIINGSDEVAQAGGRNFEEDGALIIVPGGDEELAYAVYSQGGITLDKPVNIEFELAPAIIVPGGDEELAGEFWLGLSNYTLSQWEWRGPFNHGASSKLPAGASIRRKQASAIFSLSLNSETLRERYVSPPDINSESKLQYVVLVMGTGDPDAPNGIKVITSNPQTSPDYFTNKPAFVPVFDPVVDPGGAGARWKGASQITRKASSFFAVNLGWDHISSIGTDDDRNTAFCYQVRRQALGSPLVETIGIRFLSDPEGTSFRDPPDPGAPDGGYDLPEGFPLPGKPQPGTRYTYMIKAFNHDGFQQGFSGPTSTPSSRMQAVDLEIDAPKEVRADYISGQGVLISWSEVEGALNYEVHRLYAGDSFATGMGRKPGTQLLDQAIEEERVAYYYVVAHGSHLESPPSPVARGYAPNEDEGNGVLTIPIGASSIRFRKVPAGELQLGSPDQEYARDASKEDQYQSVLLIEYYISETEISNELWNEFIMDGGYTRDANTWTNGGLVWRNLNGVTTPPYWTGGTNNSGTAFPGYPVLDVSWYEAVAFANWVQSKYDALASPPLPGAQVSLPTEAEWEYAAEGPTSVDEIVLYPWAELGQLDGGFLNDGDDNADMQRCNSSADIGLDSFIAQTAFCGAFPLGASWCGALDMAGNVAEWTLDEFDALNPDYPNPWFSRGVSGALPVVVRGGNFQNAGGFLRSSHREIRDIDSRGGGVPPPGGDGVGVRLILLP